MTTDGSGPSFDGASAWYDPPTSSWRTFQACLLEVWELFSESWPSSGMTRNGRLFRRQPLVRRTSGSGSFSSHRSVGHQAEFPTPTGAAYGSSGNAGGGNAESGNRPGLEMMARLGLWPTPTANDSKNDAGPSQFERNSAALNVAVRDPDRFPTPRASDGEKGSPNQKHGDGSPTLAAVASMWPTPTAGDAKASGSRNLEGSSAHAGVSLTDAVRYGNSSTPRWATPKSSPSGPDYARAGREESGGDDLATQVARGTPGQLNPTWVEWLMGFPLGWTDLEPSETP
jgi:hypothetical protein